MARSSVATDDFNRADGAIGSNWSYIRLSSWQGNPPHIVSNALAGRALGTNHQVVRWNGAGSFSNDQYAKIALGGMGWFGTDYMIGAVVRCSADTDANADYYAFFVVDDQSNGGNKTCKLVKRVNGTETVIATITTTSWTNGDTVELEAEGTTLRIYKNGSQIGSDYTGQTDLASGKPGILIAGDLAGPPAAQDWEGGDITGSAPDAPSAVTAGTPTPNSVSISWTDNSADETGFKVRYTPSPYSSFTTATGSVAASPYLITGLTDSVSYKASVAAFNGNGDSTWVESGIFTMAALTKLRPSADTSTGSWSASSGSVLYTMIDESVADDADYITTSSNTVTKIKLETATDPGDNSNHALRIRARSTSGTLTVRLVEGNPAETTIVSWVPTLTSSFADYDYNLTTAEASVITDYSALYVKFTTS